MKITIHPYVLDVDVKKTINYYNMMKENTCTCAGCRNFCLFDNIVDPRISSFLSKLGIPSLAHFIEIIPCHTQKDATLFYAGFTHICGTIVSGTENYFIPLTDTFSIAFSYRCDLVDARFPTPVFQLDISASIPWLLPEVNDY